MRTMISFQCDTAEEAIAVIEAVRSIGKEPHACSKKYVDPEELLQSTLNEATVVAKEATRIFNTVEEEPPRQNVSPGPSAISKIGEKAKTYLLNELKGGRQPEAKYAEHLKLLWSRGEIKFDGKEYYL